MKVSRLFTEQPYDLPRNQPELPACLRLPSGHTDRSHYLRKALECHQSTIWLCGYNHMQPESQACLAARCSCQIVYIYSTQTAQLFHFLRAMQSDLSHMMPAGL